MKLFTSTGTKNAKLLKLIIIGVMMLTIAVLIIVTNPLRMIIESQTVLQPGTLLYRLWKKPPLDVFISVYIFNVTNLKEFTSGIDRKIKLQEVGPYVYQEILENHNVTFNANNTITYTPVRTMHLIPERSVGDPKVDMVISPNLPYMGMTSAVSSMSAIATFAFNALTKRLNSQVMVEVSVHEYLWGYEDPIIQLGSKFLPSVINFKKFGLFDRMFDEGHNVVTMKLPESSNPTSSGPAAAPASTEPRDYSIDNLNGDKGMKLWDYREGKTNTACNTLNGTFDGTLFPRNMHEGDVFRVFRKAFCRSLPLVFSHMATIDGIRSVTFKLPNNAFDTDLQDPATSCFCKGNKCLKKGLGNVTPCYYNIPLSISFPHFMHADPSLREPFEGLHPDEAKHSTEAVLQPDLGIPMRVHSRFQANMMVHGKTFNKDIAPYADTVLPLLWVEIGMDDLRPILKLLVRFLFNICPYLQLAIAIGLILGGVFYFGAAFPKCWLSSTWHHIFSTAVDQTRREPQKGQRFCVRPLLKQQPDDMRAKILAQSATLLAQQEQDLECALIA